ncbi:ubiquitin thioesterase OTUB2-like isoform X2 [Brachyhypopomus gauderio]
MDESKLISIKESISPPLLEETGAPNKLQDDCHGFEYIRRVKGDGNCFYRALCFRLLETLLSNESDLQIFKDKLIRSQQEILTAGFDESTFKDSLTTFLSVLDQLKSDVCEETLLGLFNDQATSDSMVRYLRLFTSAHLQNHAGFFQHFVEAPSLRAYCTQEVEVMGMESDHVDILALSQALDVSLCIISVDGSDGHLVHHITGGSNPSVYLLYKTFHYDILYNHRDH